MNIKKVIKIAMADKGVRPKDLAEHTGMLRQSVYNVFSCDEKNVGMNTLTRFADALDCDIVLMDRKTGKIYGRDIYGKE